MLILYCWFHTKHSPITIRCPICRFSCKAKSIRRVKFVERQINNLLVKCPNHVITIQKAQYLKDKKGLKEDQNNKEGDPDTGDVSSQRQSANDDQNNEDVDLFIRDDHDDHVSGQKRKRPHDGAQNITNKKRKLNDGFEDLCDWIGPLSDLTSHSEQCSLQLDPCGFCSDLMLRRELTRHHQDCGHYPMKCGACGEADILRHSMDSHIEQECPMTMISCHQQCGMKLQRRNAKQHIDKDCTETVIKCAFHRFGCFETFKRKDEITHIENASMNHTHLLKVSDEVNKLTKGNEQLCLRIDELEQDQEQMEETQEEIEEKYDALFARQQKQIKQHKAFERKQTQRYQALEAMRKKQFRYILDRITQVKSDAVLRTYRHVSHYDMDNRCINGADGELSVKRAPVSPISPIYSDY